MASKTNFLLLFLVVLGIVMMLSPELQSAKADDEVIKLETNMTFYLHDYSSQHDPNATDLPVVGFSGKVWSFLDFGTLVVFDDLLTQGPELTSPKVGRAQGTSISVSLDGANAYASIAFVFTNEAYNGSIIQVHGTFNQLSVVGEFSVVSGTGKFRYARGGYLFLETLSYNRATSYSLFRANISVRHY